MADDTGTGWTREAMSWRENDFYRYYVQQPPITRTYLLAILLVSVPPLLYLVSPTLFLNFWDYTIRGEVWRPLTAFLYGGGGISLLFGVFFAYQYSTQLETGKFGDSSADYAFYLLFSMINLMVSAVKLTSTGSIYKFPEQSKVS